MIRLDRALRAPTDRVHVVASGPSGQRFIEQALDPGNDFRPGDLVISVNDAAYDVARVLPPGTPHVHFCVDYPYAKTHPVARGALGVWVRPDPEHPIPALTEFPVYVMGWERSGYPPFWGSPYPDICGDSDSIGLVGCGGYSAWNFADQIAAYARATVHLWGFDGRGKYESMRPALVHAAAEAEADFIDHAGRLTK